MVRLDNIHDVLLLDAPLAQEVDGGDKRRTASQFRHIELQHGEHAQLVGARLDSKLDCDGRMIAFLQLGKQRMEMEHGRELLLNVLTVGIGAVLGGDIARHYFLTKDVAITLELTALASAAVATVEHAWIGLVVAYGPHHPLQDERREGLSALHKGQYEVLIFDIEVADMLQ